MSIPYNRETDSETLEPTTSTPPPVHDVRDPLTLVPLFSLPSPEDSYPVVTTLGVEG